MMLTTISFPPLRTTAIALFAGASMLLATGCAKTIDPNVYSESSVGVASEAFQAVVLNVRPVTVQNADKLTAGGWGSIVGAGAGGLVGSEIGAGVGQAAAIAGGAIVAGAAGALAERELSKQPAVEYVVKYWESENMITTSSNETGSLTKTSSNRANEKLVTLVQGPENVVQVGQKAFLLITRGGRARVVADPSYSPQVNKDVIDAAAPPR